MPSQRDVLNWFRMHEVKDRMKLGKTALIDKLLKFKVRMFDFCMIFSHEDLIE